MNASTETIPLQGQQEPFFRKLDWSAFWTATIISFIVYFYTCAPTVTLEDSGELAVGGDFMGVPHPPGYPIWAFMSYIISKVFIWVPYRGQPNPAWSIALLSGIVGAFATGCAAMLICRSGSDMLTQSKSIAGTLSTSTENAIAWVGGVVSSVLFALSPVNWSQSVIVEAYSLNALFLALMFLLVYRWTKRPSDRLLWVISYVFGLGLTNYQVLLLGILPLVIIIMLKDLELFRDFMIVGLAFVVTLGVLQLGSMPSMPGFTKLQPIVQGADSSNTLIPIATYIVIFIAATAVVAACVALWLAKDEDKWSVVPTIILIIGGIALLGLLASVPSALPMIAQPNQDVFKEWPKYFVLFFGAMAGIILLCSTFRGGYLLAIALVTIETTLAVLVKKGALLGLTHPSTVWFKFYVLLNFVLLGLTFLMLPRGKAVSLSVLFAQLGVAFYGYMPLVSDLRNPPMNWGYPRTWDGFKHALTRGQYEKIQASPVFSAAFVQQIFDYFSDLREQFTLPMALLGFLPFAAWQLKIKERSINALFLAIIIAIAAALIVLLEEALGLEHVITLARAYKFLIATVLMLLGVGAAAIFISIGNEFVHKLTRKSGSSFAAKVVVVLILAGTALGLLYFEFNLLKTIGAITEPLRQVGKTVDSDTLWFILGQTAALLLLFVAPIVLGVVIWWLMQNKEFHMSVTVDENSQKWIISTLFGFLCMSVFLMVLANPKGDIQDAFIQRVKFISSHAIFSFWIGYGLIFGLAWANLLFRNNVTIKWLSLGTAMMFMVIPLYENGYNKELIKRSGGAEMNGHDFGWQFGNYQLRGADAITEELIPDEEPLPNPEFPPEMGPRAVFYGGTDPGRFVPTYMIYSAEVRTDVFLITQNALADSTYMNVMRDLYGDLIWIPAVPDSAEAFKIYVEEVQAGKRPSNADLKIENGRVQVSGALGVMEINGILAEMIFKHNRWRHDFYVEESYVIPWMYPYLTPHGLIMKINRDMGDIPPQTLRDDTDFWDWYTRRLMSDRKFLRDVVARKSFSKLRSAIAGLYSNRGKLYEAERAFLQAKLLYPLSPEANFRLAQEIYMRMNRFTDARELITDFGKQDPGNTSAASFTNQVGRYEHMMNRLSELEAIIPTGKLDIGAALELMDIYRGAGMMPKYMHLARSLLEQTNMPVGVHMRIAKSLESAGQFPEMARALDLCIDRIRIPEDAPPEAFLDLVKMYAGAKLPERMTYCMQKYLSHRPNDWRGWMDMGIVSMAVGRTNETIKALQEAVKFGGQEAANIISGDQRFASIRNRVLPRGSGGGGPRDLQNLIPLR